MQALRKLAITFLSAVLGGAIFWLLAVPLPWLLGSLFAASLLALTVGAAPLPGPGVRIGQMTIGLALGLYFTAPVIVGLLANGTWIVLSAILTCLLSLLGAALFQRLTGCDAKTSFYSAAIGAASDMAQQAAASGARADLVALVHSIRVFLVVSTVPWIASAWLGSSALSHPLPRLSDLSGLPGMSDLPGLAGSGAWLGFSETSALAAAGVILAWGFGRLGLPNPWVLGPLVTALLAAVFWLADARLAPWLVAGGQVLLGWNLGQRFDRARLSAFASAARAALVMTGFYGLMGLGLAGLIWWATGLPWVVSFMATAPGGIAEMAIVAKVLGLDPPTVTAFHAVRMILMVVGAQALLWLGLRLHMLRASGATASPGASGNSPGRG
ncbi:MAG: AbrB family transcriptional regulator [Burkholderiaceae bacterium]